MAAASPPIELLGPDLRSEHDAAGAPTRARDFARDVVAPAGDLLDRLDPSEVAAAVPLLRAIVAQGHREGLTRLGVPRRLGGVGLAPHEEALIVEELATADAAIAALLVVSPVPFRWAAAAGAPSLVGELARPYFSGARTDWIGCCGTAGAVDAVRARALRDGWSLHGETAPLAGGAIATHALIACTIADDRGAVAPAAALVPLDADGVERRPEPLASGLRGLCRARLVLDGVRLRGDHLAVATAGRWPAVPDARAHGASALLAFGIGRAAYEGAVRWAREGRWAGDPAAAGEHVRPRLYRMFTVLEAARALVHPTYLGAGVPALADRSCALEQARAACAFAVEAACEVAAGAARLCGGGELAEDVVFRDGSTFHPSKLLRDAQATRLG